MTGEYHISCIQIFVCPIGPNLFRTFYQKFQPWPTNTAVSGALGKTLLILGSAGQRSRSLLLKIEFLAKCSFPDDNLSIPYPIEMKLIQKEGIGKGKNPIDFGVSRSKVKVTVTKNRIFYQNLPN